MNDEEREVCKALKELIQAGNTEDTISILDLFLKTPENVATPPANLQPLSDNNLFAFFDKAKESIEYPKLTFLTQNNNSNKIVVSMAGEKSKFNGQLYFTDGGKYGSNALYLRIARGQNNGYIYHWYPVAGPAMKEDIAKILNDPLAYAKLTGQKFSFCCFCSTEIRSKNSLAVGYGPICASKWGLPWEGMGLKEELKLEQEQIAKGL